MTICLSNGVKAQFYDSADKICFYILETHNGKSESNNPTVRIFNFDGRKACELAVHRAKDVQKHLRQNPDYYGELVETTKYSLIYNPDSYTTQYTKKFTTSFTNYTNMTWWHNITEVYDCTSDRKILTLYRTDKYNTYDMGYVKDLNPGVSEDKYIHKEVSKNYLLTGFFGEGRQRK